MAKEKRGALKLYKSYMFQDRDPVIDHMRAAVDKSGASFSTIANDSGLSKSTLRNWFTVGRTKRPQFATCQAAMKAIGFEFQLGRVKSRFK